MRNLTAAICVLAMPFLFSQAAPDTRHQSRAVDPCLPSSEFALSGLKLHESESTVRKVLGKPRRVTKEEGEDDGGVYIVTALHYRHLKVEIVRGLVDRLYTVSSRTITRSGIRPGMQYAEVSKVLGKEPQAIDGYPYCFRSCDEREPAYFALKFNDKLVLLSIDIWVDRP